MLPFLECRHDLCTVHLNQSVGLITCERRLFGKTAKQESSLRSGSVKGTTEKMKWECSVKVESVVQMIKNTPCLSRVVPKMQQIMEAVSLWTRPPALHLCAGP